MANYYTWNKLIYMYRKKDKLNLLSIVSWYLALFILLRHGCTTTMVTKTTAAITDNIIWDSCAFMAN